MKMLVVLALLGMSAMVACRPEQTMNVQQDTFSITQDIDDDDDVITGKYSWIGDDGVEYWVQYIADEDGYRVIDSNAVPRTAGGMAADGNQGSFDSDEYDDDFSDQRSDEFRASFL